MIFCFHFFDWTYDIQWIAASFIINDVLHSCSLRSIRLPSCIFDTTVSLDLILNIHSMVSVIRNLSHFTKSRWFDTLPVELCARVYHLQ